MGLSVSKALSRKRRYFPVPDEPADLETCVLLGAHYDDGLDEMYLDQWVDPLDFVSFFPDGAVPTVTDLAVTKQEKNLIEVAFDWFSPNPKPKPVRSDWIKPLHVPESKRRKRTMSNKDVYLNCPYDEKDKCKSLGGWWDPQQRKWYVPGHVNPAPFARWIPKGKN